MKTSYENKAAPRVLGLDTLRITLALIVLFGHLGLPIILDPSSYANPWSIILAVIVNSFNGPAAVVCFFAISGFCIHYPYLDRGSFGLLEYFGRRHIRIWIPIIAAVVMASLVGLKLEVLGDSILWSLIAEEIYYLLYPMLRIAARKYSWSKMIVGGYLAAILLILSEPGADDYPSYGIAGNWILGLPVWMTGCLLAQQFDPTCRSVVLKNLSFIWLWRLGMIAVGCACGIARFHLDWGYPWTLTICSPLVYFWLRRELVYYLNRPPIRALEKAGMMTYSVYLTHIVARDAWVFLIAPISLDWLARCGFFAWIAVFVTVFYFLVEKPSHLLARATGRWIARRQRGTDKLR